MKFSVSSYSFSQAIRAEKMTQADCVAKAKELGFDAVEFIDLVDEAGQKPPLERQKELARAIRAEADRVGLPVNAYAVGACLFQPTEEAQEAEIRRLMGQLDIAGILGATVLRHDVCYQLGKTGNSRSFDLMLPTIASAARRVTAYGETLGIRTCTENHGFIAQDSDRLERLFNAVNHDNYGLLVDIGNFVCVDEDPAAAVSRLAPYAIHVHLKDMLVRPAPTGSCRSMTRGGNYFCGTVVGEGDIPVERCLRILKRAGYDGFLTLEYEGAEDCFSGISRGLRNARAICEQL